MLAVAPYVPRPQALLFCYDNSGVSTREGYAACLSEEKNVLPA